MKTYAKRAIDQGELSALLEGSNGFGITNPYAPMPTDTTEVIQALLPEIIEDLDFRLCFLESLTQLANDAELGWLAIYYLLDLFELEGKMNVDLVDSQLVLEIGNQIASNKKQWVGNCSWVGEITRGGIWGAIGSINDLIYKKRGIWVIAANDLERSSDVL